MKHLYFIGIGGAGLSALAQLAQDAGYKVSGSDAQANMNTKMLLNRGIDVKIGQNKVEITKIHANEPIDWVIASSAIAPSYPEIEFAKKHVLKITKRDELINTILSQKKLKLLAVSGTHGKTTTTGMLIWLFKQFGLPVSYIIGTNVSFGSSGEYRKGSKYLVLEADEFDRHMLAYHPDCVILPSVEYDHKDTYPTVDDYKAAFCEFVSNSHCVFTWRKVANYLELGTQNLHLFEPSDPLIKDITLNGTKTRENAFLAVKLFGELMPSTDIAKIIAAINGFPGTERRMEKLAENLYSDYAHHPTEIAAAIEQAKHINKNVVVVYQPHQNLRQHEIQGKYGNCFADAKKVYWLPTYLSREDPKLETLKPQQLVAQLSDPSIVVISDKNQEVVSSINNHRKDGDLVLILGAGDIDPWARDNLL